MEDALNEQFIVVPDAATLAETAATTLMTVLAEAIRVRGRASAAIPGGTTPRGLFALLAAKPYSSALAWNRVHVFWTDERCVAKNHPDSNYGLAWRLWLSKGSIPPDNIHRMPGELPPDTAASAYAEELKGFFGSAPRFDAILLGIGADGHTASLFPYTMATTIADRLVCSVIAPSLTHPRLSLTLPLINKAHNVIFLVSGHEKAAIVGKLRDPEQRLNFPAGRVQPSDGELIWIVDQAAAASKKGYS
ncbi:MAG TPA: 6-phosphogluconolactonase [Dissulfurispiraceae bacterium]|nr:6-phosphogluconolactonase [Dissulfurispiraceae bacterium]